MTDTIKWLTQVRDNKLSNIRDMQAEIKTKFSRLEAETKSATEITKAIDILKAQSGAGQ